MKNNLGYKIAIAALVVVVIVQTIFLLQAKPKKKIKHLVRPAVVAVEAPAVVAPAAVAPKAQPVALPAAKPAAVKGRIAIVIDDWGYNLEHEHILEQIHYSLTAAILPNLEYSSELAGWLNAHGFEIILHLPMEPFEKTKLENDTITTSMDKNTIRRITDSALKSAIYAKGVSNHMGSRVTADQNTMKLILAELKNKHLYFLDSFVSPKSVGSDVARKMRISFARRDIFLDNDNDPAYIRKQVYRLKYMAKKKGSAIGIGHDRKNTLETLRQMMPELEKEGYKFVFVSELVK